ncbi:MAG: hypothetical protein AAGM21_10195 [Pseudomonadota bacterium]
MIHKTIRLASTLAICAALSVGNADARTIDNPDDRTVELLADYLAGNTPNFRERALNSIEYRRANEFDKPQVLQDVEDRLRSEFEGFGDVEALQLRVRGDIGQFDAATGVYRISVFKPGTYFPFKRGYGLFLDNAADFYEWSLPVAEARKVREISPRGSVIVELQVTPFGVFPNDQRRVRGQVIGMKLFEQRSGQLIHEVALPADQRKSVESAAAQKPSSVDEEAMVLAGVRLSMSIGEARVALADAGFTIGEELGTSFRFSTYEDGLRYGLNSFVAGLTDEQMNVPNADHFRADLNCGDDLQVHSCGVVYFDRETRTVESIALLQNAVGTSKQDIVTALTEKFGPAGDRFNAYLWRKHAVDQYVWGGFTEAKVRNHHFTEISGPKAWQVEAFIAEPTPQRKTAIVQMNRIPKSEAVTGGGGIKF